MLRFFTKNFFSFSIMSAILRKKARRNGLRKYLLDVLKQAEDSLKEDNCEQIQIVAIKNSLQKVSQELSSLDDEILSSLDPEEIEKDVSESMKLFEPVHLVEAKLDDRLNKITLISSEKAPSSAPSSSSSVNFRLPKFELPFFNGDPLCWQGFWDQFNASIHSNESIRDIDRFNYLKRYLKDEALSAVSGLSLCSENYLEAIKILQGRYGNEQVLIQAHMSSLWKLKKIRRKDDVKGLRKLYDDVENCVRNLKALKVDTPGYGSLLIPILRERLPDEILMMISRQFGDSVWTLEHLLKYFHQELRALENCIKSGSESSDPAKHFDFTASNLLSTADVRKCVFCFQSGHSSVKCRSVTNHRSRKEILRKYSRCFICLQKGHVASDCTLKYTCNRCQVGGHNISICPGKNDQQGSKTQNDSSEPSKTTAGHTYNTDKGILLQTAKATVLDIPGNNSATCRILFDSGSQRTYVDEKVAKFLKLKPIRSEKLLINTFGNIESFERNLDVVQVKVKHREKDLFVFIEALCVPSICSPLSNQSSHKAKYTHSHLSNLSLADEGVDELECNVELLIGLDYYHSFFSGQMRKGESGPVALESILGWVLSGPLSTKSCKSNSHCFEAHTMRCDVSYVSKKDDTIRNELSKFWQVEEVTCDNDVVNQFEKDIIHDGERYVTKLPFKPDHEPIPDNFEVCEARLKSLKRQLMKQNLQDAYQDIMTDYETKGIIERVPDKEIPCTEGMVHYLPHRPVIREDKETTKVRAVFDASCDVNGPSLNNCLYSGPNLLGKIFDILLRFRLNPIAILADIKQAFLNVSVSPEHRDFLRFLWQDENEETIIYRFLRVVFGLTSSPFLLNGTIRHHMHSYSSEDHEFVVRFLKDLYVDDVTTGCSTLHEGQIFYKKAMKRLSEAGFLLRKWVSNDPDLQRYFDTLSSGDKIEIENGDDISFFESQEGLIKHVDQNLKRVLGMGWDIVADEFVFEFDNFLSKGTSDKLTKRDILSISASLYDPLGFITPVTAYIKTIFQILCKDKLNWDDEVPNYVKVIWFEFMKALKSVNPLKIKRFSNVLPDENVKRFELHGFSDSSNLLYCAIVYLRVVLDDNEVKVFFISSKSKVAPLKTLSIPRLELLGCVLLTKLLKEILSAVEGRLEIDEIHCWTDSTVALHWINGKEKMWKPWVENRVIGIRRVVPREQWHHVSGNLNPADIPTRKIENLQDVFHGAWFKGPEFLLSRYFSLEDFDFSTDKDKALLEAKSSFLKHSLTTTTVTNTTKNVSISQVIDSTRFSSLSKLIRTTSWVLRFINNMKKKKKKESLFKETSISLTEYEEATQFWLKDEQNAIRKQSNFEKVKKSLRLFEDDDGLLRVQGRFMNSKMTRSQKFPLLLRNGSWFTSLVVINAHDRVLHHGVETTLAYIRAKYWIVKGRRVVKDILRKCVICIHFQGQCLKPPASPDLPDFRVCCERAFETCGVDFAGPLSVRQDCKDKNCSSSSFILLITCATSRAIHLELVPDLKVPAFLRAFRRFTARRGVPSTIVHDNAKTFRSVVVTNHMVQMGIKQKFILPASPWWGGFYERLVRSVKTALRKTLGRSFVSFEELQTILCDIEAVINSRPLVYKSDDDMDETLTPNHLIFGHNYQNPSRIADVPVDIISGGISKRVRYLRHLLTSYWKVFTSTYLNELRQAHSYRKNQATDVRKLLNGDVVLIKDDTPLPRNKWRMGKVMQLVTGKDGKVRGARLRVISKEGRHTTAYRPVQKLVPFEIIQEKASDRIPPIDADDQFSETVPKESHGIEHVRRIRRQAAVSGQYERRLREKYF